MHRRAARRFHGIGCFHVRISRRRERSDRRDVNSRIGAREHSDRRHVNTGIGVM
jgi:hypothetical protein